MPGQTEPADSRAAVRAIAVIVLMTLALVALRGYLPGPEPRPEPEDPVAGAGSVAAVIVMLTVSIGVLAISILAQAVQRPAAPVQGEPRRRLRGERLRLRWRPLVIATLVLLAWVAVLLLLMDWLSPLTLDQTPSPADPGAPTPAEGTGRPPPPVPEDDDAGGGMFGILAAATIVLFVLSAVATIVKRRRPVAPQVRLDTAAPASSVVTAAPDLARAAELGLAEMDDPTRDPREAIIACYLAMERELEKSPGSSPQASDTPTEVLARAIEVHALQADSATMLVDLFEEARFSPHVMDEAHRADAVRALQTVQRDLQVAP
ncbi:hypothetical protein FHR72_000300 [Mycolicibacterium iranicum]|uniref:Protein-glutamine gamma-glutamyltransferase-like C-terminal domain-containing protein n=1 Tax=Mycolicibacterium iranicum TaxID=912594 RepID=A0A839Q0A3_MYCIR|nr:DUF4129 domain-containing protein [Mycolicibacterium iranicum]MBB2988843.1 hypothetical protein [Mycolicibacterium iranicum]